MTNRKQSDFSFWFSRRSARGVAPIHQHRQPRRRLQHGRGQIRTEGRMLVTSPWFHGRRRLEGRF